MFYYQIMQENLTDNQNILSQFTKGLFWSYDINKLDYIKNSNRAGNRRGA
jgi:hypothetical protein